MRLPVHAFGLMSLFVMTASGSVWALDTDQFTVPPQPLDDPTDSGSVPYVSRGFKCANERDNQEGPVQSVKTCCLNDRPTCLIVLASI